MAKKKGSQIAALNMVLLSQIVAATAANSFVYTSPADHAPLLAAGLVEINTQALNPNGDGSIGTRSTDAGNAAVAAMTAQGAAGAPARSNVPSAFVLEDGFTAPAPGKRGFAKRGSSYPFDSMNVAQSFFIPCTVERADPATSLASTVAAAMRRYDVPVNNQDGSPKMVQAKRAQRDDAGDVIKGPDGKISKVLVTVQEMKRTRHFVIKSRTVTDEMKPGETLEAVVARLKTVVTGALSATAVVGARVWRLS